MEAKKDIFDRIMSLPGLRIFFPLYAKYKEVLLYLFFGVLTMVVSIVTYWLFAEVCTLNVLLANFLSWIFAVLFAYFTNRTWVFDQKPEGLRNAMLQMVSFFSGRIFTLLVEELILWVCISLLGWDKMLVKIAAQVIIIVLNYLISKLFVFRKKQ